MTVKAILLSITILISMFFVDIERIQFLTIMTIVVFILFYVKVPSILVLLFVALSWSILYKNSVINEANTLFNNTTSQYKKPQVEASEDNIITAEVITLVNKKNLLSFDVKVIEINNTALSFVQPKLALKWSNPEYHYPGDLGIGQVWRFKVRLIKPKISVDDNVFPSFKSRLLSRHIQYIGLIEKGEVIQPQLNLRGDLYQMFKSVLPINANPMLYALTFGDRSYINNELWAQFKLLGIGHLVAISGLHIGLIFGFFYVCSRRLLRLFGGPYNLVISLSISLVGAIFYAWIAGFSLPALRAIVLLCIHCLYRVQYYKVTLFQLFATMLLVTLLLDPLTVFSISFWLSFSAMASVFILVWLSRTGTPVRDKSPIKQTIKNTYRKLTHVCCNQVLFTLLLLPIQMTIFSGFSWLSAIINLIFIPIFSVLILPVLLFAVILLPVLPMFSRIFMSNVNTLLDIILEIWETLTSNDVIWIDVGTELNTVFYNCLLLMFVLFMAGLIFKPLQVTLHSLSLLLLPLVCYSHILS
ncbi:ComEC/Rec2 family competence protein [Moritella viscosa]|uniref:DNA internalization-related competence protein n=1 Tax=Moritella viscosa TaxID=80854 RepID=A0ABY1HI23_9GAMM|nr:ComEC/Rec2 family competence protein [Moritella viscosa]SGY98475.1 DNA internalization-related competence protein [Moritella viscosa]SGZ12537.1 DNA internalization-related competence protein [Moritella viscosa]SHO27722.1 DNA internalization-related competence protein [Moritella viscosa]